MTLERLFKKEKITIHSLYSHELTHLIQCALAKCKRAKIKKSETNCFPVNAWFDEECKKARRMRKESNKVKHKAQSLQSVIKQEKGQFHGFKEGRTNLPWEK